MKNQEKCDDSSNSQNIVRTRLLKCGISSSFMEKYDITGRTVQVRWLTFSGHTAIQIKREIQTFLGSTEPCAFRGGIMFMSMFNDVEYQKPGNEQKCFEYEKEVTEYTKAILVRLKECGTVRGQTSRRMGSHRKENNTEV